MDLSLAYLLGCYLGDGCSYTRITKKGSSYQFSITSEDEDLCVKCQEIVRNIFDKKYSNIKPVLSDKGNIYYQLVVCSKQITQHFSDWTQKRQVIPNDVYASQDTLCSFSRGLMDTDGWISKTHPSDGYIRFRVGFKNTLPWVDQFRDILKSVGVQTGVLYPVKGKPHEKHAMAFTLNTKSYCSIVNFGIDRKKELAKEYFAYIDYHGSKKNIQF